MKSEVWRNETQGFGGKDVKQICGSAKSLDPVRWRHASLEQKRADNIYLVERIMRSALPFWEEM
jgi:hypothetical protein